MKDDELLMPGDQPLSEEEKALLEEIYARLDVYIQYCAAYHEEARISREVLRLRDPEQDTKEAREKGEKLLQLQTLKSTFNNVVADQLQNMPEPHLLPESPDMEQAAADLQDAVRFVIYSVNRYQKLHRMRAEELYCTGTSVTQVVWDPDLHHGQGDVAIIPWPVEAFLWDPMAADIQQSRALIKVSWHPLSWLREHYPEAAPYIAAEDNEHQDVGLPETQRIRLAEDEPRAALLEYWYRRYDAKKRRYTISVAYCAGHALLEHYPDVYMHGMYPFVMDAHSTVLGQPVGDGMVSELTPMMRYINRYAHYIDTNLRMSSKSRMLTRKGSGIDREALANWEEDMIEGDSIEQGRDWAWMQHAPFNGAALQTMLQMQSDLKMDSGANQFTRGETTGGVVSGKAIASLIEAGGKITGLRTDTLNEGFQSIVEQVMWLMAEFYDEDRMVMITGRRGTGKRSEHIRLGERVFGKRLGGVVQPPPYTVQVEINRRNPALVSAQNEVFMQAYTMAAQAKQYFPLSALFELMHIDGKDRLLPVIRQNEHHMEQMQQMQTQLEQQAMQMEQLQKENDGLRMTATQMTNALANVSPVTGGAANPLMGGSQPKVAQAGGGPDTQNALVDQARMALTEGAPM